MRAGIAAVGQGLKHVLESARRQKGVVAVEDLGRGQTEAQPRNAGQWETVMRFAAGR